MTLPPDDAALLAAELLARRWLPRQHPRVRRALIDADVWQSVQERLAQVGLRLVDNIHADHVAVALLRGAEASVFGEAALDANNNVDLPRDAVSLLVVLWSLIVLPKRERQAARAASAEVDAQNEMFSTDRPMPAATAVSLPFFTETTDSSLLCQVSSASAAALGVTVARRLRLSPRSSTR